jgi:NAD(P)-dependent dehydrogenase (short-subunit alcohol dehydrogenase family)
MGNQELTPIFPAVVLAGRHAETLAQTATEAGLHGSRAFVVPTDVSDEASVRELFDKTRQKFGRLDLLFNNAGIGAPAVPLEELPIEQWRRVLASTSPGSSSVPSRRFGS